MQELDRMARWEGESAGAEPEPKSKQRLTALAGDTGHRSL